MSTKIKREDNGKNGKLLLFEDDKPAGEIIFSWIDDTKFVIQHTIVDKAFGGKGYGKLLVLDAIDYARSKGVKIVPECTYAAAVIQKDTSLHDVRA